VVRMRVVCRVVVGVAVVRVAVVRVTRVRAAGRRDDGETGLRHGPEDERPVAMLQVNCKSKWAASAAPGGGASAGWRVAQAQASQVPRTWIAVPGRRSVRCALRGATTSTSGMHETVPHAPQMKCGCSAASCAASPSTSSKRQT